MFARHKDGGAGPPLKGGGIGPPLKRWRYWPATKALAGSQGKFAKQTFLGRGTQVAKGSRL